MQRSQELEELVSEWFAAATRGDPSSVDRLVSKSEHTLLIGSDPDERITGGAAVAEFLRGEVAGAGGNVTFSPAGTEAFEEGSVGWAITNVTITLPDGGQVAPRWSSVFHREDDEWRFVHTHASIGVPNDEIGWIYTER